MRNCLSNDSEIVTVTKASALSGKVYAVGGILGVAAGDTNTDTGKVVLQTEGIFTFTKATGFAPSAGDVAFYDKTTDQRLEAFSASGTEPIGFYRDGAATGDTTADVVWDPALARQALEQIAVRIQPTANTTQTAIVTAAYPCKVVGISYFLGSAPSSSAGTCLLTIKDGVGGNTMLNAANFDLETATVDALTALTLSGTPADLVLGAASDVIEIKVASNNADLVAGEGLHLVFWLQRT